MTTSNCEHCGSAMAPSPRPNRRFCSDACRMAAEAAKRREARRPVGKPFECEQCGSVIERRRQQGRFPRFCSMKCRQARDREARRLDRLARNKRCTICDADMGDARLDTLYCSRACSNRAQSRRQGRVPVAPAPVRFWQRVQKTDTCWNWTGARLASGYGSFAVDGRRVVTHRYAWELLRGPVPAGLQVDHLCRNRLCCNPDHLEPVTQQENLRRSRISAEAHAALLSGVRPDDTPNEEGVAS